MALAELELFEASAISADTEQLSLAAAKELFNGDEADWTSPEPWLDWLLGREDLHDGDIFFNSSQEVRAVQLLLQSIHDSVSLRSETISPARFRAARLGELPVKNVFAVCNQAIMKYAQVIDPRYEQGIPTKGVDKAADKRFISQDLRQERPKDFSLDAKCLGLDPNIFYPETSNGSKAARKICKGCKVAENCLEFALENNEDKGVWGGTSERERSKIKRRRRLALKNA